MQLKKSTSYRVETSIDKWCFSPRTSLKTLKWASKLQRLGTAKNTQCKKTRSSLPHVQLLYIPKVSLVSTSLSKSRNGSNRRTIGRGNEREKRCFFQCNWKNSSRTESKLLSTNDASPLESPKKRSNEQVKSRVSETRKFHGAKRQDRVSSKCNYCVFQKCPWNPPLQTRAEMAAIGERQGAEMRETLVSFRRVFQSEQLAGLLSPFFFHSSCEQP